LTERRDQLLASEARVQDVCLLCAAVALCLWRLIDLAASVLPADAGIVLLALAASFVRQDWLMRHGTRCLRIIFALLIVGITIEAVAPDGVSRDLWRIPLAALIGLGLYLGAARHGAAQLGGSKDHGKAHALVGTMLAPALLVALATEGFQSGRALLASPLGTTASPLPYQVMAAGTVVVMLAMRGVRGMHADSRDRAAWWPAVMALVAAVALFWCRRSTLAFSLAACVLGVTYAVGTAVGLMAKGRYELACLCGGAFLLLVGVLASVPAMTTPVGEEAFPVTSFDTIVCAVSLAATWRASRGEKGAEPTAEEVLRARAAACLSERELQVFDGLLTGSTIAQIAATAGLSRGTVSTYCGRVYQKLGVSSKSELLALCGGGLGGLTDQLASAPSGSAEPTPQEDMPGRDSRPVARRAALLASFSSLLVCLSLILLPWMGRPGAARGGDAASALLVLGVVGMMAGLLLVGWVRDDKNGRRAAALAPLVCVCCAAVLLPGVFDAATLPWDVVWIAGAVAGLAIGCWAGLLCAMLSCDMRACPWAMPIAACALGVLSSRPVGALAGCLAAAIAGSCSAFLLGGEKGVQTGDNRQNGITRISGLPSVWCLAELTLGGAGLGLALAGMVGDAAIWPRTNVLGQGEHTLAPWALLGVAVSLLAPLALPKTRDRHRPWVPCTLSGVIALMVVHVVTGGTASVWGKGAVPVVHLAPMTAIFALCAWSARVADAPGVDRDNAIRGIWLPVLGGALVGMQVVAHGLAADACALALMAVGALGLQAHGREMERRASLGAKGVADVMRFTLLERGLTAAEVVVAERLARGHTPAQVAASLHLSKLTVATHRRSVYAKIGVHSQAELTRVVVDELREQGLLG